MCPSPDEPTNKRNKHFLRTLRAKALAKLEHYPDLFNKARLQQAASIYDFDDAVTAPVHGFADAHDYYSRSSSLGFLERIRIPTLLLSAVDDPFLPPAALRAARAAASPAVEFVVTRSGGHTGFIAGSLPWRAMYWAEELMVRWTSERASR